LSLFFIFRHLAQIKNKSDGLLFPKILSIAGRKA
jgi:hypothetical protein